KTEGQNHRGGDRFPGARYASVTTLHAFKVLSGCTHCNVERTPAVKSSLLWRCTKLVAPICNRHNVRRYPACSDRATTRRLEPLETCDTAAIQQIENLCDEELVLHWRL